MQYMDYGIRTRNGAYWLSVIMTVSAITFLLLDIAEQPDRNVLRIVVASAWIIGIFVLTIRILNQLGRLEQQHSQPTEAMKFIFQLGLAIPALGIAGLLLGLM